MTLLVIAAALGERVANARCPVGFPSKSCYIPFRSIVREYENKRDTGSDHEDFHHDSGSVISWLHSPSV